MDAIALCTRAQVEMFGEGRVELVDEITTSEVIDHGAPPDGTRGREAMKGTIRWIHSGLDDVAYDVKDVVQSDDKVVLRCTFRGTNTREWMGHQPTGKSFLVDHIHIYRIEGDRIAEHWGTRDDLGMLHQIGHLG
jgi:predicted ester cyclase